MEIAPFYCKYKRNMNISITLNDDAVNHMHHKDDSDEQGAGRGAGHIKSWSKENLRFVWTCCTTQLQSLQWMNVSKVQFVAFSFRSAILRASKAKMYPDFAVKFRWTQNTLKRWLIMFGTPIKELPFDIDFFHLWSVWACIYTFYHWTHKEPAQYASRISLLLFGVTSYEN